MGSKIIINKRIIVTLILILFAFFIRIYKINLMEFKSDEVYIYNQALNITDNFKIYAHGIKSSTGVYNSPFISYFYSIPLIINKSPVSCVLFTCLLNSLTIILLLSILNNFNPNFYLNLFCILLYVSIPSNIIFSRKIWLQSNLQFFSVIFIFLVIESLKNKNSKLLQLLTGISFSLLIQTHMSGFFLIIIFMYYILMSRSVLSIISFTIITFPLFRIMLAQQDRIKNVLSAVYRFPSIKSYFNNITGLFYLHDYSFVCNYLNNNPFLIITSFIFIGILIIFLVNFILFVKNKYKFFIILYLVSIIAFPYFLKIKTYPHYYLLIYPLIPVILTAGLNLLKKINFNLLLKISVIIFAFIILFSIYSVISFTKHINKNFGIPKTYGIAYKYKNDAVKRIIEYCNSSGNEKFYITSGINYVSTLPFEFHVLLKLHNLRYNSDYKDGIKSLVLIDNLDMRINDKLISCIGKIIFRTGPYFLVELNDIKKEPDTDIKKIYFLINNYWYLNFIYRDMLDKALDKYNNNQDESADKIVELAHKMKPF